MSFKEYIREQEELKLLDQEKTKKQKLADFFRSMQDLNDEKFHEFATDELGMDEEEAETIVYKMLRDFLLKNDENEDGIPDDIEDELLGDTDEVLDDLDDNDEVLDDLGEAELPFNKRFNLSNSSGGTQNTQELAQKLMAYLLNLKGIKGDDAWDLIYNELDDVSNNLFNSLRQAQSAIDKIRPSED